MDLKKGTVITLGAVLFTLAVVVTGVWAVRGQSSSPSLSPPASPVAKENTTTQSLPSAAAGVPVSPESETADSPATVVVPSFTPPAESIDQAAADPHVATLPEEPLLQSSKAVQVDARQFRQLLPKDAIAPIYDPEFSSAQDADIDPRELVIGVEINGESRAYPIGPLARREMVNDVVGGVPILVTW